MIIVNPPPCRSLDVVNQMRTRPFRRTVAFACADRFGPAKQILWMALFLLAIAPSVLLSQDIIEATHPWTSADLTSFEQLWTLQKSEIRSATIEFRFILVGPNYLQDVSYEAFQSRLDKYFDAGGTPEAEQELVEGVISRPPPGSQAGYDMVFRCDGARTYERMAIESAAVEQVYDGKNFVRSDDRNRQTDVYDKEPSLFRHELTTFRMTVPPKMASALRDTPEKLTTARLSEDLFEAVSKMKSGTSHVRFQINTATGDLHRFTLESRPDGAVERELRQSRFTSHVDAISFPYLTVACRYQSGKLNSLHLRIVKTAEFNTTTDDETFRVSVPPGTTIVDHTRPTHVQSVQVRRNNDPKPVDAVEFVVSTHIESNAPPKPGAPPGTRTIFVWVNLAMLIALVTVCGVSAIRHRKQ